MADYRAVARHHPAVRAYLRHRRWLDRAGVMAYAGSTDGGAFSTDSAGFRHGQLDEVTYGTALAFTDTPYALVLGSSHVFGFGLDGNDCTIPSQLARRTGLPCLNLSFPEAQLHALYAVALRISAEAPRPPRFIALLPGGTLTRFAYVRSCDRLFGVPDFGKGAATGGAPGSPTETAGFAALLAYSAFWIGRFAALAQMHGCPLVLYPEATAFEKPELSANEIACCLTQPHTEADRLRFDTHRLRYAAYTEAVTAHVPADVRLAHCDPMTLGYVDEFHYDAETCRRIADALTAALA